MGDSVIDGRAFCLCCWHRLDAGKRSYCSDACRQKAFRDRRRGALPRHYRKGGSQRNRNKKGGSHGT